MQRTLSGPTRNFSWKVWIAWAIWVRGLVTLAFGDGPSEPLFNNLPPGVFVQSTKIVPSEQAKPIAKRLGAPFDRLSNSSVVIQGRSLQVNVIASTDEENLRILHAALGRSKPFPLTVRRGDMVVEFVGSDIDTAIVHKAVFELGLVEKPKTATYQATVDIATIDTADYMACNTLFNAFLNLQKNSNNNAIAQIGQLSKRFVFGSSLSLRNPESDETPAKYTLQPSPENAETSPTSIRYSFTNLPIRHGVPYVTTKLEITTTENAFRPDERQPPEELVAPTKFWPSDDPEIKSLADTIVAGKTTHGAKAMAILEWLSPGKNVRYAGETGSRYGVKKVLQQKFGHCWDFSDCFVTLARAAGIPCRQVGGWLYGSSGHVWAEFHRAGKGWQQVDPTGGGLLRCGIYHIPYFATNDGEMPILYVYMPRIELLNFPKP